MYISKPYAAQSFSTLCKGISASGLSKFEWQLCQINDNRKYYKADLATCARQFF